MPEKRKITSTRIIEFLGKRFLVDVLNPPQTVELPSHTILDNDGKDKLSENHWGRQYK